MRIDKHTEAFDTQRVFFLLPFLSVLLEIHFLSLIIFLAFILISLPHMRLLTTTPAWVGWKCLFGLTRGPARSSPTYFFPF